MAGGCCWCEQSSRRYQLVATGALLWGFLSLGTLIASFGPSLLGFERQTGASPSSLSLVLTTRSCGYLLGSIISGPLLDKFVLHGNSIIGISLLVASIATAVIPYVTTVGLLAALVSTQGAAMGTLDPVGNILLLNLHGENAGPWMQALHAVFAIGTLLSPLIVRASMAWSTSGTSLHGAYITYAAITGFGSLYISLVPTPPPRKEKSHAASLASQDAVAATALSQELQAAVPVGQWKVIALTSTLLGLYVGAETGFGSFLILYATRGASALSEASGQYVTAVYWGALAIGRVLAIPLSLKLKVRTQLLADVTTCIVGLLLLMLGLFLGGGSGGTTLLWLAAAVYGLGMASVFPTAFMLAESLVSLNGRAASVLMVGSATGEMLLPLVTGLWTQAWAPGFVVVNFLATVLFSITGAMLCLEVPQRNGGGEGVDNGIASASSSISTNSSRESGGDLELGTISLKAP